MFELYPVLQKYTFKATDLAWPRSQKSKFSHRWNDHDFLLNSMAANLATFHVQLPTCYYNYIRAVICAFSWGKYSCSSTAEIKKKVFLKSVLNVSASRGRLRTTILWEEICHHSKFPSGVVKQCPHWWAFYSRAFPSYYRHQIRTAHKHCQGRMRPLWHICWRNCCGRKGKSELH